MRPNTKLQIAFMVGWMVFLFKGLIGGHISFPTKVKLENLGCFWRMDGGLIEGSWQITIWLMTWMMLGYEQYEEKWNL